MVLCKGKKCSAVNGMGHSVACSLEHAKHVFRGAGNRHPYHRYVGYSNEPLPRNATQDQMAAYYQGKDAREIKSC